MECNSWALKETFTTSPKESLNSQLSFKQPFFLKWQFIFLIPPGFDGFDVRKIDDHEYTVEISCYFLTKWKDDRLILHEDILSPSNLSTLNQNNYNASSPDEEQWYPIDLEFVAKVKKGSQ